MSLDAVAVSAALVAAPVAYHLLQRHVLLQQTRRVVLVETRAHRTFRGVLRRADRDVLVLAKVTELRPDDAPLAVDGELLILRSEVELIQRP